VFPTFIHPLSQVKDGEEYNVVAAREAVGFTITFTNPTQLKLKLTEVQLICELQPAVAAAMPSVGAGGGGAEGGALPKVLGPAAYQTAAGAPAVAPEAEQVGGVVHHVGKASTEAGRWSQGESMGRWFGRSL
jgi:hypothetical protein